MGKENSDECAIPGCDRLASGAPDTNGDLCGDHRDVEFKLGRPPMPLHEEQDFCGRKIREGARRLCGDCANAWATQHGPEPQGCGCLL